MTGPETMIELLDNIVSMTTYRVVIELKCVYSDGSEETISSALVAEEEREDRAEEKYTELMSHAEVY